MADLRLNVAAVRALAGKVLDGADRIDELHLATMQFDEMADSAVARAAAVPLIEERVAELVAHMRTWAAAAQASATAIDAAEARHARQIGDGR